MVLYIHQYTWTNNRLWRKNRRKGLLCSGVDLNRNYNDRWAGVSGNLLDFNFIILSCTMPYFQHAMGSIHRDECSLWEFAKLWPYRVSLGKKKMEGGGGSIT